MSTTHVMPPRSESLRAPPPVSARKRAAPRWPLGWAALVLPGVVRAAVALASGVAPGASELAAWLAPGVLVIAWVAWVHRRGARPLTTRLQKELRPLAPVAAAMSAVGVAAVLTSGVGVELALPVVLSALSVVAFSEGEHGTLTQWLAQPLPRWRLFAEKGAVVAVLALAFVAQVLAVAPHLSLTAGYAPCVAAALGLAPALALGVRGTVNALAASTLVTLGALVAFGTEDLVGVPPLAVIVAVSAALVVLPWAVLLRRRASGELPELTARRLWRTAGRSPVGSLVRKEARLQLPVFLVLSPGVLLWLEAAWHHQPDVAGAVAGFFGVLGALLAGAIPVTSEHEYGTWSAEAALVPMRTAWRVKLGVSLAAALLVGVGLPALLIALTPGPVRPPDADALRRVLTTLVAWASLTALAWSSGLLASTLTRRMTTSFLAALGLLGGAVTVFALSLEPGMRLGWRLLGKPFDAHAGRPAVMPDTLSSAVRVLAVLVVVALPTLAVLRSATAAQRTARLPAKAWAALAGALALAGFCAGLALS